MASALIGQGALLAVQIVYHMPNTTGNNASYPFLTFHFLPSHSLLALQGKGHRTEKTAFLDEADVVALYFSA